MSFVATLRAATAIDHERVDAAFGAMRLDERDDYRRMLTAHARAVPGVEAVLARADPAWGLPAWTPRTPLLVSDLAALNVGMPDPLPFDLPSQEAATWGALYVAEGSRLGGQVLARGIAAGLPHAYLRVTRPVPGGRCWQASTRAPRRLCRDGVRMSWTAPRRPSRCSWPHMPRGSGRLT